MTSGATLLMQFGAAQQRLDAALAALDADAILIAAGDMHEASVALSVPGAWHDSGDISAAIAGALARIESCRLRVMFLADHGARAVDDLTRRGASPQRWRPDRCA